MSFVILLKDASLYILFIVYPCCHFLLPLHIFIFIFSLHSYCYFTVIVSIISIFMFLFHSPLAHICVRCRECIFFICMFHIDILPLTSDVFIAYLFSVFIAVLLCPVLICRQSLVMEVLSWGI